MIIEGIATLVTVGALLYVAPSVFGLTKAAAPMVWATQPTSTVYTNGSVDATLNASAMSIGTSIAGGLSLTAIVPIMMGIGLMIGAFMIVRGRQ